LPNTTTGGQPESFHLGKLRPPRTRLSVLPSPLVENTTAKHRSSNMLTSSDPLQVLPEKFTSSRLDLSMRVRTTRAYPVLNTHDNHASHQHLEHRINEDIKADQGAQAGIARGYAKGVPNLYRRRRNKFNTRSNSQLRTTAVETPHTHLHLLS
jgi:hypothetical protein